MRAVELLRAPIVDPGAEAWRREVRAFLAEEMRPAAIANELDPTELTGLTHTFERAHHVRAGARGFLGISMPVDVGGGGRPPSWKAAYDFEAAYHDAPTIDTGVTLCGQPLAAYGSASLRRNELAAMVAGDMTACIAYTEAGAGSDLGALAATGVRVDGTWLLHGRKVLVTGAHRADVCMTLVRTDPGAPPKRAFSMFLVPMSTPGVRVTRRPTINGWTLEDVEFDNVRVGDDRVVGEVGAGWSQVLGAIGAERAGAAWLGWSARRLEDLLAAGHDDPRLIDLVVEHAKARRFCERVLRRLDADQPLEHTASVAKVASSELLQAVARLGAELHDASGAATLFTGDRFAFDQLERLHCTIGGGTSEIQRDTIARFLRAGMEPAADLSHGQHDEVTMARGCRQLLDMTLERLARREQFGQPLDHFQVVRHRLADMLVDVESIELSAADPSVVTVAERAGTKLAANHATLRVIAAAHQLCGGYGYLEESGLGPITRSLHACVGADGSTTQLRRLLQQRLTS